MKCVPNIKEGSLKKSLEVGCCRVGEMDWLGNDEPDA